MNSASSQVLSEIRFCRYGNSQSGWIVGRLIEHLFILFSDRLLGAFGFAGSGQALGRTAIKQSEAQGGDGEGDRDFQQGEARG